MCQPPSCSGCVPVGAAVGHLPGGEADVAAAAAPPLWAVCCRQLVTGQLVPASGAGV